MAEMQYQNFMDMSVCTSMWSIADGGRLSYISRHTVVCRAAQEAGAPHREYIYRKKVNAIFTPLSSVIPYPIKTKVATEIPAR